MSVSQLFAAKNLVYLYLMLCYATATTTKKRFRFFSIWQKNPCGQAEPSWQNKSPKWAVTAIDQLLSSWRSAQVAACWLKHQLNSQVWLINFLAKKPFMLCYAQKTFLSITDRVTTAAWIYTTNLNQDWINFNACMGIMQALKINLINIKKKTTTMKFRRAEYILHFGKYCLF